ncbi:hypothetical protein BE221DRAFT_164682 [Ostreococcus tauri]|uniref:Uncharacterized protein n=1 Tax=Ostreococcus tauri TaxID=70448 RepID=A0A1Y5HZ73_OSTTA|nr:hypothetical protein BE221DRAFT_164682 [Ostreococcus tauri]
MDVSEEEFGIVPVDEYTAIFPFPTKTANDASPDTSHEGFWVTWYVEAARADSGKGSGANKLTYGRRLSPWSVKERVKVFVSTPPTGFFSQRDVFWQTIKWPYDKDHAKWLHALIPATRLEDFRRGIQLDANTEFSVWNRVKKGRGGGRLYVDAVTWHCCCGPEDKRVRAEEKFARMLNGTGVRVSRKREHVTRDRLPYHVRNTYQSKMREYGAFIKSGKLRFELRNSSTVYCDAERREILASVHVQVTNTTSGVCSTHEVSNLHMLQTSALQRHHQLVTCNCMEGRNDVLCFAKLHAMVEANLQYTLAAFQLDDNVVHDDTLRARREECRRVSHDNARGLKQNSENSGTGTIRKSNTSSQAEIYELLRRVQSIAHEEDPIRKQKAVTALKVAVKELEAGNEKRQVEPGDETTSVPFRESIPSDSGIGMHIFASATGKLPHMEHKRSHLNEDSLVRGKGILERKRSRSWKA